MKTVIILVITLISISSCTSFDQELTYYVEPELQIHVDKFYEEAAKRNFSLEKYNLMVVFDDNLRPSGLSKKVGDQRVVYIQRETYNFYMGRNEIEVIEFLIAHELGHALLYKPHDNIENSIMNQSTSMHSYEGNPAKRKEMLDYLFN